MVIKNKVSRAIKSKEILKPTHMQITQQTHTKKNSKRIELLDSKILKMGKRISERSEIY